MQCIFLSSGYLQGTVLSFQQFEYDRPSVCMQWIQEVFLIFLIVWTLLWFFKGENSVLSRFLYPKLKLEVQYYPPSVF